MTTGFCSLQEHFPAASIAEIMRQYTQTAVGGQSLLVAPRSFQDSCVQTPTHFVEKNMDKDYEWNEWALRRRALHLANLRQKVTKSQQTTQSAMRREAETQVYLPKDDSTMTGAQPDLITSVQPSLVLSRSVPSSPVSSRPRPVRPRLSTMDGSTRIGIRGGSSGLNLSDCPSSGRHLDGHRGAHQQKLHCRSARLA